METLGAAWVPEYYLHQNPAGMVVFDHCHQHRDAKVIGWALSKTMNALDTVVSAFKMAQKSTTNTQKLIFHSDRGIQYACHEFRSILEKKSLIIRNMSRKGNCWDNALAESFLKTLKAECLYQHKFAHRDRAVQYIETRYNRKDNILH